MILKFRCLAYACYRHFLNILAPPFCAYCKEFLSERIVLCSRCTALINPIITTTIDLTTTKQMKVFAISDYKDPIKRLILAKGFSDIIASQQLGTLAWQHTNIKYQHFDVIIPVPLHWTRYAHRGYNQAHEMAKQLGVLSNKPVVDALKRISKTVYQAELSQEMRAQNVKNVFKIKDDLRESLAGKHILLVDDLMTTGSTLKEAGRALLVAKPASITIVVAARVL